MAGTPYARTVPSHSTLPASALPDPGLVFDLLLKRDDSAPLKNHPGGLSAMFFAVANLFVVLSIGLLTAV
jgi:linoleate 10R-lipoxygenase